jgi:hypothetical protein
MKIQKLFFPLIIVILIANMCSCGVSKLFINNTISDEEEAKITIQRLLTSIENKDKTAAENIFSKSVINSNVNFEKTLDELFQYMQGDFLSFGKDWSNPDVEEGINDDGSGRRWKVFLSTYEVKTTVQNYRFAIKEYKIDSLDSSNIGIYSLYVVETKKTDEQFAYWGDGNWTPGINIDIVE